MMQKKLMMGALAAAAATVGLMAYHGNDKVKEAGQPVLRAPAESLPQPWFIDVTDSDDQSNDMLVRMLPTNATVSVGTLRTNGTNLVFGLTIDGHRATMVLHATADIGNGYELTFDRSDGAFTVQRVTLD